MHPRGKQDIVTCPRKLRTGYCDIPNTVPKQRKKKVVLKSIHFLVFKFGISGPKIQNKDFIARLSLLFRVWSDNV